MFNLLFFSSLLYNGCFNLFLLICFRYRVIELALQLLNSSDKDPLLIFSVARFMEVCSQHKETGAFLIKSGGVSSVIKFLEVCHSTHQVSLFFFHKKKNLL